MELPEDVLKGIVDSILADEWKTSLHSNGFAHKKLNITLVKKTVIPSTIRELPFRFVIGGNLELNETQSKIVEDAFGDFWGNKIKAEAAGTLKEISKFFGVNN